MGTSESERTMMRRKKDRIERAVKLACKFCQVKVPKINFDGCPYEWKNDGGIQLAHYHSGMICVSERQLKLEHLGSGLEETAVHEVMHHLGFNHGTDTERTDFERRKNQVLNALWRDLGAPLPQPTSDKRKAYSKPGSAAMGPESEIRLLIEKLGRTNNMGERAELIDEISKLRKQMNHEMNVDAATRMHIDSLESSEREAVYTVLTGNPLTEKEQEELIKKAYAGKDWGFGDEHGENRWNRSRWYRLKKKLGFGHDNPN
jgi:hypothetical protein